MNYSVYLFACDSEKVSQRLRDGSDQIVAETEARIRAADSFSNEDVLSTMAKVESICAGDLPLDCDAEYFHALCWMPRS